MSGLWQIFQQKFGTRAGNFGTRPDILALDQKISGLDQEIHGKTNKIQEHQSKARKHPQNQRNKNKQITIHIYFLNLFILSFEPALIVFRFFCLAGWGVARWAFK